MIGGFPRCLIFLHFTLIYVLTFKKKKKKKQFHVETKLHHNTKQRCSSSVHTKGLLTVNLSGLQPARPDQHVVFRWDNVMTCNMTCWFLLLGCMSLCRSPQPNLVHPLTMWGTNSENANV